MKQIIACLFVLSSVCSSSAQSLFEIKYRFPSNKTSTDYTALLVTYNNYDSGYMRVSYFDSKLGIPILVDMDVSRTYPTNNGITDSTVLVYAGKNPVVIGGDTNRKYNPDLLWFKKNPSTGYFEPWGVTSPSANKTSQGIFVGSPRLLKDEDLTRDYVSQFFFEDEPFYQNLFTVKTRSIPTVQQQAKLYIVLVGNTNEKGIGSTCKVDLDNTRGLFSDIATKIGIKPIPVQIDGDKFNKKNVEAAVNGLKPSNQDIVVFYYSGHGFSYDNDPAYIFPQMDLRYNARLEDLDESTTMNIEDIYKTIKNKKARLTLVISDCCNTFPGLNRTKGSSIALTKASSLGLDKNHCMDFFMNQTPMAILVTAAAKGEAAACDDNSGGFFTSSFTEAMEKYLGKFINSGSWNLLINDANTATTKLSRSNNCEPDGAPCKQNPLHRIEVAKN